MHALQRLPSGLGKASGILPPWLMYPDASRKDVAKALILIHSSLLSGTREPSCCCQRLRRRCKAGSGVSRYSVAYAEMMWDASESIEIARIGDQFAGYPRSTGVMLCRGFTDFEGEIFYKDAVDREKCEGVQAGTAARRWLYEEKAKSFCIGRLSHGVRRDHAVWRRSPHLLFSFPSHRPPSLHFHSVRRTPSHLLTTKLTGPLDFNSLNHGRPIGASCCTAGCSWPPLIACRDSPQSEGALDSGMRRGHRVLTTASFARL